MTRAARSRTRQTVALAVLAGALVFAAVALAATLTVMRGSAKIGGKTKAVVVDAKGATLYTLSGERVGNLKCLTTTCFAVWPPLKVSATEALTKGPGVTGTLSRLRRVKGGFNQVMLDGHPLYRYAGDNNAKGSAKGDGIRAYGGTWHVASP